MAAVTKILTTATSAALLSDTHCGCLLAVWRCASHPRDETLSHKIPNAPGECSVFCFVRTTFSLLTLLLVPSAQQFSLFQKGQKTPHQRLFSLDFDPFSLAYALIALARPRKSGEEEKRLITRGFSALSLTLFLWPTLSYQVEDRVGHGGWWERRKATPPQSFRGFLYACRTSTWYDKPLREKTFSPQRDASS
jgi:hypothetical protein